MDIDTPSMNVSFPNRGSNGPHNSSSGDTNADLLALMKEKDNVESELKALGSVLDSHNVTMQTPLCTFDGYPRDDIDVAQIRTTRSRIIYLRNDYKSLMNKIEKGLHAYHASIAASATADPPPSISTYLLPPATARLMEAPFAKINTVAPRSPAAEAGMRPGDYIKEFGSANALNHARLTKVTEVVAQNEGRSVEVVLSRKKESGVDVSLVVNVKPRKDWGGRGLLGCHLLSL